MAIIRNPFHFSYRQPLVVVCACLVLSTGCSSISESIGGTKVDYRTSGKKSINLEVPPDLTQLSGSNRYVHTAGAVVSASDLENKSQLVQSPKTSIAPTSIGGVSLEREGQLRWLSVKESPEQLWGAITEFWGEQGFELTSNVPTSGLLETNWSENRAKLSEDGLRNLFGTVLDKLYDTGERDRYRTRVERTSQGSAIYISHRGLVEVYTDTAKQQTTWKARPSDIHLEALMLTKLMTKLGASKESVTAATAALAPKQEAPERRARVLPDGVTVAFDSNNFDQAWRRLSLTLDRAGFTVEDRDRNKGVFDVRLIADQITQKNTGLLNTISGWFDTKSGENKLVRYRLQLLTQNSGSTVSIQGEDIAGIKKVASLLVTHLE